MSRTFFESMLEMEEIQIHDVHGVTTAEVYFRIRFRIVVALPIIRMLKCVTLECLSVHVSRRPSAYCRSVLRILSTRSQQGFVGFEKVATSVGSRLHNSPACSGSKSRAILVSNDQMIDGHLIHLVEM